MKKTIKCLGIIALIAVIGFTMVGCDNGTGGGGGGGTGGGGTGGGGTGGGGTGGGGDKPLFSVSGEFGTGSGNALFKAATAETVSKSVISARSARSARSVVGAGESYELTGELKDGDMLFSLKGTYDPSTGSYTVSSASSFARYTVNGTASGATATLAVKQGEGWNSFIVSVTIKEVTIPDGEAVDYAGGLPSWAQGNWHDWWAENPGKYTDNGFEAWSYFDQWYYEGVRSSVWRDNWDQTKTKYTVISAESVGDGVDVIFSYPFYKATDAQKKAALKKFFEDNNHPAEFWNKTFNPWDTSVWCDENGTPCYDDSVIWYICRNENHDKCGEVKIVNWDTLVKLFPDEDERVAVFAVAYDSEWWPKKEAIEAFFEGKGVPNVYYWGQFEPGYVSYDPETNYTCWEPVCEDGGNGGWWNKTHYYVKWGNETGIQGDWDKYGDLFSKWSSDDYLVTYLRSQNVQPETWYTRARMRMDGDTFVVQYYNGSNEAGSSHAAPACDTKSLSKIQSLTFNENYWDYSYLWQRQRASPRSN